MQREKTTEELVEEIQRRCPYDAAQQRELWLVYNLGLFKTIVARWAREDWILKEELKRRAAGPE